MKKSAFLIASLAISLMPSCIVPPGPSVASLGPGSDAAYLNASRGRYDAQITSDQARQYSRQRNQVSEEMALEREKRGQTFSNWSY